MVFRVLDLHQDIAGSTPRYSKFECDPVIKLFTYVCLATSS